MKRLDKGLTLIELILVMMVLTTVLGLYGPKLSRFFSGRTLQEEGRRMIALTQYGRSQAISTSVPMELWIDAETREYGLSPVSGYGLEEEVPVEFTLAEDLVFQLEEGTENTDTGTSILFMPDGSIDADSPERLTIVGKEESAIAIVRSDQGMEYVIEDKEQTENESSQ